MTPKQFLTNNAKGHCYVYDEETESRKWTISATFCNKQLFIGACWHIDRFNMYIWICLVPCLPVTFHYARLPKDSIVPSLNGDWEHNRRELLRCHRMAVDLEKSMYIPPGEWPVSAPEPN